MKELLFDGGSVFSSHILINGKDTCFLQKHGHGYLVSSYLPETNHRVNGVHPLDVPSGCEVVLV